MSGISRMIAKQLSASLGITDNPKYNPMFKQTEEVLTDVADPSDPTVARFYSPLESAIDEAPIGKEGTRGENIEAFVRKRAPKVTQAEMEYRGLGLEPGELYTAETAKEGLKGLDVKAVKKGFRYRNMQRQSSLQDKELDYTELGLDASDDLEYFTHYGPSNLAHTRYSLRGGDEGNYILIEELQSDPLQNVVDDVAAYTKKTTEEMDAEVSEILEQLEFIIESEGSGYPDKPIKDLKSYIYDTVIPTRKNKTLSDNQKKDIFKEALDDIGVQPNILTPQGSLSHVASEIVGREFEFEGHMYLPDLSDMLFEAVETGLGKMETVTTKKDLPVQRITDSIRMSLQAIIADAKGKGVDEIVLPPVEKLAEQRFDKDELASKIAKGSAFYNTYVAAYQKVLKQLKNELGNQVKVGKKPLNYYVYDDKSYKQSVETVQGTLLDISNLTIDPANIKLRFNKGGLVERPTK